MDTILGIPPGESYSGIRVLADLSVCVKIYQQRSTVREVKVRQRAGVRMRKNGRIDIFHDGTGRSERRGGGRLGEAPVVLADRMDGNERVTQSDGWKRRSDVDEGVWGFGI